MGCLDQSLKFSELDKIASVTGSQYIRVVNVSGRVYGQRYCQSEIMKPEGLIRGRQDQSYETKYMT